MTIETLKSPNPRNRNSISVIKSKYLSVSSMSTLLAILKVTDARRDVILAGGLCHRFPWRHLPSPGHCPNLGMKRSCPCSRHGPNCKRVGAKCTQRLLSVKKKKKNVRRNNYCLAFYILRTAKNFLMIVPFMYKARVINSLRFSDFHISPPRIGEILYKKGNLQFSDLKI